MDLIDREQLMNYIRSTKINIGKLAHDIIMKQESINAVSEEVYTEEFNLRKDAEFKVYKLEKALEQEPTKREIEREYLFQSLCEDFKKLQAENDDLRKRLEQEPCEDCISRQEALDCLTASGLKKFDFILDARDKIKNLPSVRPQEPKTGHWIKKDGYSDCSECGSHIVTEWDYCPNCGAKMESEDKE